MAGTALTGAYIAAVRPWMHRHLATEINAPVEQVWPWLAQIGQDRERVLLLRVAGEPGRLHDAQRRSASTRITGLLDGLPGAVAVELVHNFSLLHDDLMDGDLERRHRRTVWAIWGAPDRDPGRRRAARAGARGAARDRPSPAPAAPRWLLATTTRELTRGQVQDVAFESRSDVTLDECLDMAGGKTGALLAASAAIGAVLAGAADDVVDALTTFGSQFGLAFQLVDDVLGIWGDPTVTGKPVYSDLRSRKKSLPVTYALGTRRPRRRSCATGSPHRTSPTTTPCGTPPTS